MARLHVLIEMHDDAGVPVLSIEVDEPTRIDVERDPLFIYSRMESVTERALQQLHDYLLRKHAGTDRGQPVQR